MCSLLSSVPPRCRYLYAAAAAAAAAVCVRVCVCMCACACVVNYTPQGQRTNQKKNSKKIPTAIPQLKTKNFCMCIFG